MRRHSRIVASLAAASLLFAGLAAPVDAGRPEPWISRLVATTRWVTDSDGSASYYVLWMDLYAVGVRPQQYTPCVRVTYPDGSVAVESGYAFPRSRPGGEVSIWLQLGVIPDGATSISVSARIMRLGAKGCCTPVGAERIVEALLPVRPPAPPAPSVPQVVFDVTYPTP